MLIGLTSGKSCIETRLVESDLKPFILKLGLSIQNCQPVLITSGLLHQFTRSLVSMKELPEEGPTASQVLMIGLDFYSNCTSDLCLRSSSPNSTLAATKANTFVLSTHFNVLFIYLAVDAYQTSVLLGVNLST